MLTLLFDKQFWISLLICLALAGVVVLYALKPKSRPYIITALCGVLIVTSAVSIVNLNRYYNAQGGIRGILSSVINGENKGEIVDNSVSLNNVMLTLDEDGNYSAKIIPEKQLELDAEKIYSVLVNGLPCSYVEDYPDYILAKYEYNFYDKEQAYKTDTLEIYFTMDKQTVVEVLTRGGSEMVKYWNYYFNRNDFVIKIIEVDKNFSYKEPTNSYLATDSDTVNTIIKNNNLTLLKTINTAFEEDDQTSTVFDTRLNISNLATILDFELNKNSTNITLITQYDENVRTWSCVDFVKESCEGKYLKETTSGGGAVALSSTIEYFTYYRYWLTFEIKNAFGSEFFYLKMDYNPEFNANEWAPYETSGAATPLSETDISTYARSGYEDCNYYFINHTINYGFLYSSFEKLVTIVGDVSLYLLQGTI